MTIYEQAMKFEIEGKKLYEEMAADTPDAALKGVFQKLADFEDNHFQVFKAMAEK
ncbi:MAG: ferritin, partial [Planctomycetes bacterium]|nr:ferritin [Planctomycetota bacterium]